MTQLKSMRKTGAPSRSKPQVTNSSPEESPLKRLLFGFLMLLLTGVTIETASFVLLALLAKEDSSALFGVADPVRKGDSKEKDETRRERMIRDVHEKTALQPFLGFVVDTDNHPGATYKNSHPEVIEYGLTRSREKIFHQAADDKLIVGIFGGSVATQIGNFFSLFLKEDLLEIFNKEVTVVNFLVENLKQIFFQE